jgi:acetylornithine deacetylase
MKGFDALCLAMVPEFLSTDLKRPIHILLSYDEEIGCRGPLDTIARFGHDLPRPACAIVGEPSLMQVADAHKSITTYRTNVSGHEAHSSKPYLGSSAIEVACALIGELYRLADDLKVAGDPSGRFDPPCSTIHVGIIRGGTARNILAKECAFEWEFRGLPNVDYNLALTYMNAQIARIVAEKAADPAKRARVETAAHHPVPGLNPEPGSAAENLALKLARRNATMTVSYASEAGQFQAAGIPTIICGPGSIDQAHQPDEYIDIDQLAAGVTFMRRLAAELS